MTQVQAISQTIHWARLGKIATVCTIASATYACLTWLLPPLLTLLKGPEQTVQVLFQEAAPIIGWLVMPGLVTLTLWLLIKLVVPPMIFAIYVAWGAIEHGVKPVDDGLVSAYGGLKPVAVELAEPIGWSWLGLAGFSLAMVFICCLCVLMAWIVFVPAEQAVN
jgi:hypothetical protein